MNLSIVSPNEGSIVSGVRQLKVTADPGLYGTVYVNNIAVSLLSPSVYSCYIDTKLFPNGPAQVKVLMSPHHFPYSVSDTNPTQAILNINIKN